MHTLHDVADKEAQEVPFSCGVSNLFDAGTPCKTGGELQTRNLRNDLLSFHPDQALAMDDRHNFVPSHGYVEYRDPNPDVTVVFQQNKEPGLYTSAPSSPPRSAYKNESLSPCGVLNYGLNSPRGSMQTQDSHLDSMPFSGQGSVAMGYQSQWPNGPQIFNIQASDYRVPLSSSSPLRFGQHENMPQLAEQNGGLQGSHVDWESTYEHPAMINHSQSTSISTHCTGQRMRNVCLDHRTPVISTSTSHSPPNHHILRSQRSDPTSMSSWNTEPIDLPALNYPTEGLHGPVTQAWWPTLEVTTDVQSFSQSTRQPMVIAPTPQKPQTHQTHIIQSNNMMMHLKQSPDMRSAGEPPLSSSALSCPERMGRSSCTPLAPAPMPISRTSPFEDLSQRQCVPISHSLSLSPANMMSASLPLRSSSTNLIHRSSRSKQQIYPHTQRQRRGHIRKASSLSTNSFRGTKGESTIPTNTSHPAAKPPMIISFVNYTPEDSQKLLTGVAPSGSSKTKARREQEARDKRRQLSEAALLAVLRAGGDVEGLEAVFS
ncbi:regulatory protein wetA [Paracoccidioides lutzii Pb01]|uniref:Developmental regulatory protein wetA n=1 Tax=Paracoccidioides lutzii (strain ATCC MYA-826 / Pb01) TaxID=502779 RepID=C1H8J2_PARBA|nr:regulatory protein wetA [Paracoccidioides lutzii Pb01]EEH36570.2 regulatory protein wetA [Paracoccidioides lutzii Pb01]